MFKKLGVVTVGVTAGLLVASPFASAGEAHSHHDGDDHKKNSHHEDNGSDCNVTGGDAEATGEIDGDAEIGNTIVQLPVGGNNLANIVCNDILNDNFSDNEVNISG